MWNWIKNLFKKKQKPVINPCSTCIWWAAEQDYKLKIQDDPEMRFCGFHKIYTHKDITCPSFSEELFEATPDSTQTEEKVINHEIVVDRSGENDVVGEKK